MINTRCPLVLTDLYFYDFRSAFPRLMKSAGWDFTGVDLDNKKERNIYIGKQQINNKELSSFLNVSIRNLIDFYIDENNIDEDEIIISQKDGFVISRMLDDTSDFMELDFRGFVDVLIISIDRKKYLQSCEDVIDVKGIPNRYDHMDEFYKRFSKLNFLDKRILFNQMDRIKNDILLGTDKNLYMIKSGEDRIIETISQGPLTIKAPLFNVEDINREKYFNHYIRDFLKSLYINFY